ncbi:hypothetical protein LshimejAT787_0701150 [Lyophyllum shimeji]|uniref:Uncharacterized protein n=1 Tax=Lyophyllum shimeji TaxID=47721 RepID=A0A9P3PPE0_LYOSH|nr:hypothetical protein LshimejAT787_0701150 [Lyophyllum shimeji]
MALPLHRSTHSLSQNNLQPPDAGLTQKQQRRMTSPASNSSLNAPEGYRPQSGRPPSPLRNGFVPDTSTGIDPEEASDDEDEDGQNEDDVHDSKGWPARSPSRSSSVSQLAASFTQRVGSFLEGMAPRSPGSMPTDAELEAEAERERDRSRREAERILTREAQQRKLLEERVLAMMESTRSLPPPPSRSQTMSNPPSPSNSQKESTSWWTAAKNKLTPTKDKEPLTPAQQIIQETKAREKDKKGKGKEKDKEKEEKWLANAEEKYNDPAFLNLNIPQPQPPHRKPVPSSPSSPTPSRPNLSNLPPNLTPSPMRSSDAASSSPSREAPLMYAQFNPQGTLDVAATLLTIAKRFEKLEKWTVGHVRALEERMSDVERWLVDKEKEREKEKEGAADKASAQNASRGDTSSSAAHDIQDLKDGIAELQGRVGELGREMARLATAPSNLSSGPSRQAGPVSVAPHTTSTIVVHDQPEAPPTTSPLSTPHHSRLVSVTARESTSPPMASSKSSGTRLPYPTGDYAAPPDTIALSQGVFSPTNSPPSSITSATRTRPLSVAGLSGVGLGLGNTLRTTTSNSSISSSVRATSPQAARAVSPSQGLPPPKRPSPRPSSISPTPRKRYTVALGEPIRSPPDHPSERRTSPRPPSAIGTAFFSSSPGALDADDQDGNDFQDETIGKSAAARLATVQPATTTAAGDDKSAFAAPANGSPSPSSNRRLRAQSTYGFSGLQPPQTPVTPLRPRIRSRSSERLVSGPEDSFPTGKFVDPLVLRRQDRAKEKEGTKIAMPKPVGKVPIGQLVAFFDGEKKDKA